VTGFLVLVGFMALALLRLGPDRVPPEVWLMRRLPLLDADQAVMSTSKLPLAGLKAADLLDQQLNVRRSNVMHRSLQPVSFRPWTWPGPKSESIHCSAGCSE